MLQITPIQMQALQQDARAGALRRLAAYLADLFPERHEPWDKIAEQGLEDAEAYGVQHEREVGMFLVLQVEWGRGFEDLGPFAWAKAVLLQVILWSHPYVRDGDF